MFIIDASNESPPHAFLVLAHVRAKTIQQNSSIYHVHVALDVERCKCILDLKRREMLIEIRNKELVYRFWK